MCGLGRNNDFLSAPGVSGNAHCEPLSRIAPRGYCILLSAAGFGSRIDGSGTTHPPRTGYTNKKASCGALFLSTALRLVHGTASPNTDAPRNVTRTRPPNLLPASVDHTKAWVLKVATMDVLAIPIDPDPTPNNVWTLLQRRPDGF